jgi:hypothetical protein
MSRDFEDLRAKAQAIADAMAVRYGLAKKDVHVGWSTQGGDVLLIENLRNGRRTTLHVDHLIPVNWRGLVEAHLRQLFEGEGTP